MAKYAKYLAERASPAWLMWLDHMAGLRSWAPAALGPVTTPQESKERLVMGLECWSAGVRGDSER